MMQITHLLVVARLAMIDHSRAHLIDLLLMLVRMALAIMIHLNVVFIKASICI